jgi:hypothetical protein
VIDDQLIEDPVASKVVNWRFSPRSANSLLPNYGRSSTVRDRKSVVSSFQPSRPLRSLPSVLPRRKDKSLMDSAQGRVRKLVDILRSTSFLVQHHLNDGQRLPELAELKRSLERAAAALEIHAADGSHEGHASFDSNDDPAPAREFADQD